MFRGDWHGTLAGHTASLGGATLGAQTGRRPPRLSLRSPRGSVTPARPSFLKRLPGWARGAGVRRSTQGFTSDFIETFQGEPALDINLSALQMKGMSNIHALFMRVVEGLMKRRKHLNGQKMQLFIKY